MKKLYFLLLVLIISLQANAQFSLGIGYAGTHPLGDLLANNYKDGNGFDFYFLSKSFPQYSKIQAQIGVDFNAFSTGERKLSSVTTSNGNYADYYLDNYHNAYSFKIRLLTQENTFRYHADVDFGNRSFYSTEAFAYTQNTIDKPANYSKIITDEKAFFTGITAGVLFRISNWLSLDAYSRVDFGKSAKWLDINSFSEQNFHTDNISYQYKTTNTPLLWFGISAVIHFKPPKFNRIQISHDQTPQEETEPTYPTPEPPAEPKPRGRVAR